MNARKTMRVTGRGLIKVKPDQTCIGITVCDVEKNYEKAVRRASEDSEAVKASLAAAGFSASEIKTVRFDIEPEYEGYDENGVWKQRFKGYRFCHELRLVFDSDKEILGKVFTCLAKCPAEPEFRVSYRVKDQEAAKNLLLAGAVADARDKATILASASGVTLGEIRHIDYSFEDVRMEVTTMQRSKVFMTGISEDRALGIEMEPEDIDVADTVTIIWEIL